MEALSSDLVALSLCLSTPNVGRVWTWVPRRQSHKPSVHVLQPLLLAPWLGTVGGAKQPASFVCPVRLVITCVHVTCYMLRDSGIFYTNVYVSICYNITWFMSIYQQPTAVDMVQTP